MSKHPSINLIYEQGPFYFTDRQGRPWQIIGFVDMPTVILQRVGCQLHPMDMPRLSVVSESPWSEDWTAVDADDPQVLAALKGGE